MVNSASERHFITSLQKAEIRAAIARDPERLAERYIPAGLVRLGRRGQEIEWNTSRKQRGGGNHRFRIKLDGDKPLFTDFTHSPALAGRGVNFIARAEGLPTGEIWRAYQIAAEIYGIETGLDAEAAIPAHIRAERQSQIEAGRAKAEADRKAQEQLEREAHAAAALAARAVLDASQPATSHPYATKKNISCAGLFVATRTITARLYSQKDEEWLPQAVAAKRGDLIVPVHDAAGNLINIQRISDSGEKRFLSGGLKKGGFHVIPGIEPGFIVEGYATGATVHQATGRMVVVAFDAGQLPVIAPLLDGRIAAVAADNDASGTGEKYASCTGLAVLLPPDIGTDWNDCAAAYGLDYVRDALALPEPPKPLPPLDVVRHTLSEDMARIMGEITGPDREQNRAVMFPVGVGIGKTRAAYAAALETYDAARQAAETTRGTVGPIVITVPDHGLSMQAAQDVERLASEMGIKVSVRRWLGRGVTDNQTGNRQCRGYDKARAIRSAGKDVTKDYCLKNTGGCPYAAGCPYLEQIKATADVWIITHALTFIKKPEAIGTPFVLIIDEKFHPYAMTGLTSDASPESREARGRIRKIITAPEIEVETGARLGREGSANLRSVTLQAAKMLHEAAERGERFLTADAMRAAGFSSESLTRYLDGEGDAAGLLAHAEAIVKQGADIDDDQSLQDTAEKLAPIRKAGILFREMRRVLDSKDTTAARIEIKPAASRTGGGADPENSPHGYIVTGRKDVATGYLAPTIILDATGREEIIREFFPQIEVMPAYRASEPWVRRLRVSGQRFKWGMTSQRKAVQDYRARLAEVGGNSSEIKPPARQAASFERIVEILHFYWMRGGKKPLLAVVTKEVHDLITETRQAGTVALPDNVSTIHPAIVAGRNDWKDVSSILMMTTTKPQPGDVERMARALTGRLVAEVEETPLLDGAGNEHGTAKQLQKRTDTITTTDGQSVGVTRYTLPDPTAAALLAEITEGGMVQADGRGRGVTRTEDNPLTIIYHTDTYPDGLPLDGEIMDAASHPIGRMIATAGYAPAAETDAARLFPSIFRSHSAAKEDFNSARKANFRQGGFSIYNLIIEFPPCLKLCEYRPTGEAQKWRKGYALASENAVFVGALTANHGKPIQIRTEADPDSPLPPPSGPRSRAIAPPQQQAAPPPMAEQPQAPQAAEIERVGALPDWIVETVPEVPPRPVRAVSVRAPDGWRVGGIDRNATTFLRPEAWATGHEMGAEDEAFDPALAWLQEQAGRQGGYAGRIRQ